MSAGLPALFLPHGAPDLAVGHHPARTFLASLAATLSARIRGILIVSAHWEARVPTLTTHPAPATVHDFSGWGAEAESLVYPARTDPKLVDAASAALETAGFEVERDARRGLDHGAWVPLLLAWPEARLPLVQLSLVRGVDATGHLALGRALAPLAREGYLVIGSGASVHNLSALAPEGTTPPHWATAFDRWLNTALESGETRRLVEPERSDAYRLAHPTPEHLMPLYVAYGAGGPSPQATRLHHGYSYASVGMSAWRFQPGPASSTEPRDPTPSK